MSKNIFHLLMASTVLAGVDFSSAQTNRSSAPNIRFAETTFDFGKVTSGAVVKHDFLFTNAGNAALVIKEVRSGCGCTTAADWDRTLEAGKTGRIPVQFNSRSFNGTIAKSVSVLCNDPAQPSLVLSMKGMVWNPVQVTPATAVFNLTSELETNESRVVRIVSHLDDPIELFDLNCTNRSFDVQLKTVRLGKEFELRIRTVPPIALVPVTAPITLRTSSPQVPMIQVNAYLMLQEPVVVRPLKVMLPSGPLSNAVHSIVTIRASGTNWLALSDAHLNVPDAVVQVREVQPGRFFSLTVDFPAGFQVRPGQTVELTAKCNHPRLPLLRVPVVQGQPTRVVTAGASAEVQITSPKVRPSTTGRN
jgi:hypothetical protein